MKHRLELLAKVPLQITWHENKTTYLVVKKENGRYFLRLHRLFFEAPTPVLEALLSYAVTRDKRAKTIIRQMAHLYFSQVVRPGKPLSPIGRVYDLQQIFDRLICLMPSQKDVPSDFSRPQANPVHDVEKVAIGWSDRKAGGKLKSITFGTFNHHTRQIRIHPILDDAEVPLYFLEYIVYHEMLHALCPSKMNGTGRCAVHTKEFREKERQFPRFLEAKQWEKECITFFKKRQKSGRS